MGTVLLVLVVVLVVAALVFGVVSMLTGDDPGLSPADPDSRAVDLPNNRSLTESDIKGIRFDLALRGYRMSQVDRALRRTAYDIGYKDEMIAVLEAEVAALREGRIEDADLLRKAREAAANPTPVEAPPSSVAAAEAAGGAPDDAGTAEGAEIAQDVLAGDAQAGVAQSDVAQSGVAQSGVAQSDAAGPDPAEAGVVSAESVAGAAPVDGDEVDSGEVDSGEVDSGEVGSSEVGSGERAEADSDGDAGDGSDAENSVERARG